MTRDDGPLGPRLQLTVSDEAEVGNLRDWLARADGVRVTRHMGVTAAGELGSQDFLELAAGLGTPGAVALVLRAAIRTLPEFVRSRRSDVTITITNGKKVIEVVSTTDVDKTIAAVDKMIDDHQPEA